MVFELTGLRKLTLNWESQKLKNKQTSPKTEKLQDYSEVEPVVHWRKQTKQIEKRPLRKQRQFRNNNKTKTIMKKEDFQNDKVLHSSGTNRVL